MCVFSGERPNPNPKAPSWNSSHLTTVRPHNSPVISQDLSNVTTLSMPLVTNLWLFRVTNERTNIQTCTSRKTKDEMRSYSSKSTKPAFVPWNSITTLRIIFHGCPKQFIDSTPNLYLRFAGPWLRHCYNEAKGRSLKDGMFNTLGLSLHIPLPTFLRTEWLADWKGIQGGMLKGREGVTAPGTCCSASTTPFSAKLMK